MTKKYVMIDLDDPRTAGIAEVISNKTCKRILALLAEESLSESEIASKIGAPMNTINYNVRKLVRVGLIEQNKSFWSVKGRKVLTYKLANKKIVISPKSSIRGIVPAVIISGLTALGLRWFGYGVANQYASKSAGDSAILAAQNSAENAVASMAQSGAASAASQIQAVANATGDISIPSIGDHLYSFLANAPNSWAWFFVGALLALVVVLLWTWFKK